MMEKKNEIHITYHAAALEEAGKSASAMVAWLEEMMEAPQNYFEITAPDGLDVEYRAITPRQIIILIETHGGSDIGLQRKKMDEGERKTPKLVRFESTGNFIVIEIDGQIFEIYWRAKK